MLRRRNSLAGPAEPDAASYPRHGFRFLSILTTYLGVSSQLVRQLR